MGITGLYKVDSCCSSVCCTPDEECDGCKLVTCPSVQTPTCEVYEDCLSRPIDAACCCYEYYCECNKSKCYKLGDISCPSGYERVVTPGACCETAKCCTVYVEKTTPGTPDYTTKTVTYTTPVTHCVTATECKVCVDKNGVEREYGECWYHADAPCMIFTCYGVNDVRATKRDCGYSKPDCSATQSLVAHKVDECCTKYTCCETKECEGVTCPDTVPACDYCQELVTVQYNKCCCSYECRCVRSKCVELGDCPCPEGYERLVVNGDECCPVARCVPCEGSTIITGPTPPVIHVSPTTKPTPPHPETHTWTTTVPVTKTLPPTECDPVCINHKGGEVFYGACWSPAPCTYCQCYADGNVQCKKTECAPMTKCAKGEDTCVETTADGCCQVAFCRPLECATEKCDYTPPTCNYCEDCVARQISECCCTYSCVCNRSKCTDLGVASCPEGYDRYIVDTNICCPVARCCERTTTPTGSTITWTHTDGDHTTRPTVTHTPGTHGTNTVPTKVTTVITTEECVCVDDNGIDRYYGEVWSTGQCSSCCCTAPGKVECSTTQCTSKTTCAADEYISATYAVDKCCSSVCCTKLDCEESCAKVTCPKVTTPTCECYEDCLSRPIDADCCCYEYYCECNKSKCFKLGEATCPAGYYRQVVETNACCPVAKCCSTTTDYTTKTISYTTATLTTITPTTHITPTPMKVCIDREGCEREYGECWTYEEEPCMTYTCYSANNIQATPRQCATQPKCRSDQIMQEYPIDDCCCGYRCLDQECAKVTCSEVVPCCNYCEELEFHPIDECCCTYSCKCARSKCVPLGDCPCPEGYISLVVDGDACCPVAKCMPCTTKPTGDKTTPDYTTKTTGGTPPVHTPWIVTDPTHTATCIPEETCGGNYCYDHEGRERYYGDCWSPAECTYCICDADGTSKCSKKECAAVKQCKPTQSCVTEKTADGCCNVVHCIDEECEEKCKGVTCKFTPPTCQYYEDCVATRYDDCCCTYACVCNKSKCCDLQLADCPEGYIRAVIKADECCPTARCIECPPELTTKTGTPFTKTSSIPTGTPGTHVYPTTTTPVVITKTTPGGTCYTRDGRTRYYGEIWSVDACETCCCTEDFTIECSKIECHEPTSCPPGQTQTGTYQVDSCCSSVCCTPDEECEGCKLVTCPDVVTPTCECYENCLSKPIDAACCCYEY